MPRPKKTAENNEAQMTRQATLQILRKSIAAARVTGLVVDEANGVVRAILPAEVWRVMLDALSIAKEADNIFKETIDGINDVQQALLKAEHEW